MAAAVVVMAAGMVVATVVVVATAAVMVDQVAVEAVTAVVMVVMAAAMATEMGMVTETEIRAASSRTYPLQSTKETFRFRGWTARRQARLTASGAVGSETDRARHQRSLTSR